MPTDAETTIQTLYQIVTEHSRLPSGKGAPERSILFCLLKEPATVGQLAKLLKRDPSNIRTAIHRLRVHLGEFFKKDPRGRRCVHALEIHTETKKYELRAVLNAFPVESFWGAHYHQDGVNKTLIVWAEPLVFFDPTQNAVIRYREINSDSIDPKKLEIPEGHPASLLVPAFGYQSSGDIAAVYCVERLLSEMQVPVARRVTRETNKKEVNGSDVVILGNTRMNVFVDDLQNRFMFLLDKKSVSVVDPREGEKNAYVDYTPSQSPAQSSEYAYAVLTRRPNISKNKTVTMIVGNHGRAIEKVTEYVTSEPNLHALWHERMNGRSSWPTTFQVLFEVGVEPSTDEMVYQEAKPIAFRAYDENMRPVP